MTQDRSPSLSTDWGRTTTCARVPSPAVTPSSGFVFVPAMSANCVRRLNLYGQARGVIDRLHHRHKQCRWKRDGPVLLRQLMRDDAAPELVHKYEAGGARACRNVCCSSI